MLGVGEGVIQSQAGTKGIAANEPLFDTQGSADVFKLFAIMRCGGGVDLGSWRLAVAPKVYGDGLADLAQGI